MVFSASVLYTSLIGPAFSANRNLEKQVKELGFYLIVAVGNENECDDYGRFGQSNVMQTYINPYTASEFQLDIEQSVSSKLA